MLTLGRLEVDGYPPPPHVCLVMLDFALDEAITSKFGNYDGDDKWQAGVLAANGKVYCSPCNSNQVLVIYPLTNAAVDFGNYGGGWKWLAGVLAPLATYFSGVLVVAGLWPFNFRGC